MKSVLGPESKMGVKLVEVLGTGKSLRVLRRAEMETNSPRRRERYIAACIDRAQRIAELEQWLIDNPDPFEILDPEEMRGPASEELKQYYRQASNVEKELEVLRGDRPGAWMLQERIGRDHAFKLVLKLMKVFNIETAHGKRKINGILRCAAHPSIKYPARYVAVAIEREREEDD